jgi:uncharacterized protein (TIGR03086 family)
VDHVDVVVMASACEGFSRRVAAVEASQWGRSTPCTDWDVRTLVNHVVGELLWVPSLLAGRTVGEVGDRFDGDVLGDDPLATCRGAATDAVVAAGEPGAQERTTHLSFGDLPGAEYLGQVTTDVIIHTWDLARAIGADDDLGDELVAFARDVLTPQIEMWRGAGVLGPAVEPPGEASDQARFLALTGRSA